MKGTNPTGIEKRFWNDLVEIVHKCYNADSISRGSHL